jgi:hypothetical protein
MALPLTPEQRLESEKKEWDELQCDGKDTAPRDLNTLHTWVQTIARCLGAEPNNTDKIDIDPYTKGYILRDYFGPLQGGQLMNADGANNDCLIHSFLICVCPHFRAYEHPIRRKLARYFRRFITTQIPNINQVELNSFLPLSTSELKHLCKHYDVPFIIVKGSMYPVDREMELLPGDDEKFWDDKENSITLPYHIIHGSGAHFTPVAWNKVYEKTGVKYTELKTIRDGILKAQTEDGPINEIRKQATDKIMNDFLNNDPEIKKIKGEIALLSTPPDKLAYINTNILRITRIFHTKINSLQPVMDYRKDYAYSNELAYLTSLIGGDPVIPSVTSNKEPVFALEDMDLEAGLEASKKAFEEEERKAQSESSDLKKALLASLLTAQQKTGKQTASVNQIRLLSSIPADVRKTVQAIAKIGNKPATTYTAYVGNGVFVEPTSSGGKRRTRKAKMTKRKTKKLKK